MSTTSANPDRLDQFVSRTQSLHRDAGTEQQSLAGFAAGVRARSADFGVETPSVAAVASLLAGMESTDRFVTTITDELLAADGAAVGGQRTISDALLAGTLDRAGVGRAPVPVDFHAATMFGLPPTSGFVDDPICAANGNMIHQDLDLEFPGIAAALDVRRTYNSLLSRRPGAFGVGMSSIFDVHLTTGPRRVEVALPDGASAAFVHTPTGWATAGRRLSRFDENDDGWTIHTDARHAFRFDRAGALTGWLAGTARVTVQRDSFDRIVTMREQRTGRRVHVDWTDGRVAQIATDDGRKVSYTYDGDRLARVSSAAGALTYEWDDGFVVAVADPDGVRPFVNTYDDDGRVVRQRSPFGRVTSYRYDGAGLTIISDVAGTRQAMMHDQRGNLTAVIDVDGSAMRLTCDHADRVTKVVDRDGSTTEYRFDLQTGDLVERVDPDGLSASWTWDAHGRVTSRTDRAGNVTAYEYLADPLVTTPTAIVDSAGGVTRIEVDRALDRPTAITDADGVTVTRDYDRDGQLVAVIDAFGHRTSLDHDEAGRLVGLTDAVGVCTTFDHDAGGRLVRYARGGEVGTFGYTRAGRVASGSEPGSPDGACWSAQFGDHGAPVAIVDAEGHTTTLDYDVLGSVVAITTPDGSTYHQFHDDLGRLVGSSDPSGATSHLRYDVAGRVVEAIDEAGRVYRREVDALGRIIRSVGPDGAISAWSYHPNGEVATVVLPDGRTWATTVDHVGRVTSITDPAGRIAHNVYSAAGRLIERRSPAERVESLEYDAAGRLATIVDVGGLRHDLERDPAGRLVAVVRGGVRDEFGRDLDGRVVVHHSFDERGVEVRATTFEFDTAGRLSARIDGTGSRAALEWDARGLLAAATDGAGGVLSFEYDARGRLVAQTAPGERTSTFAYDRAGRLNQIVDPAGVVTSIDYDPSGVITGQRSGSHGVRTVLDAVGRIIGRTGLDGGLLAAFGYDIAGRLVAASTSTDTEHFVWDDSDLLVSTTTFAGTTRVERDADGFAIGLVQSDGTHLTIERDRSGHIVSVGGISTAEPIVGDRDLACRLLLGRDGTAYHYDDAGRLDRVEAPDGTDTSFEYGADGLVAAERGPHGVRRFRYDDGGRVAEVSIEGHGATTYTYDDAGRRIGELRADGTSYAFEWAGMNHLVAITHVSAAGTRHIPIVADAFGRPIRVGDTEIAYDPSSGLPSRLGHVDVINTPTGSWRSDTGLVHRSGVGPAGLRLGDLTFLGARVHDITTGQFLSPDPLLPQPGSAGSASAYTYAWHDPVNHADPSGKRPISMEEWDAIRTREEKGRLGQAWEAIKEDPWGTALMIGAVVVGGVLIATGVGAVGGGILLGVAIGAGMGLATGTFDPMDVAIGGALGAVGGGIAQGVRAGAMSLRVGVAAQGALGTSDDLISQARSGDGFDLRSGLSSGLVNAASFGIGERVHARTLLGGAVTGAAADGALSVTERAITGQPINLRTAALEATFGSVGGAVEARLESKHLRDVRADAVEAGHGPDAIGPTIRVYRAIGSIAEQRIFDETGVVLSDAANIGFRDVNSLVSNTESSISRHHLAVDEWFGDVADYAAAHAEWDAEIETVSGERTMIELTIDRDAARAAAGPNGTVLTAEVPAGRLIRQYQDSAFFTPHIIEMQPLAPAGP